MSALVLLTISTALSILLIPLAIRLAPRLGMVDQPDPRKVHVKPIPRVGGFGITLGATIPLAFLLPVDPLLQAFLVGAFTLFLFGAWDDANTLGHWVKFVGQFFAAGFVVYYGDLWVQRFPFIDDLLPAWIGQPFTIFAIVGVINAINHSDGLDGLAGGESLLSLIVMGFLAYVVDDSFAVLLCCAVAGGVLGFLRFNTHPAQIFMGDAGSQFLGFSLAFLAVYLTQIAHPALSPALPLLLIGLPIADINAVFYLRISGGMNWFKASRNHIHHRLLDLGFNHYETVIVIYLVQALLVGSAVLFKYESDFLVALIFFGVVTAVFVALTVAERRGLSVHEPERSGIVGRALGEIRLNTRLHRLPGQIVAVWVVVLIVTGALSVTEVPREFAWISGVLLLVSMVSLVKFGKGINDIVMQASLYAVCLFVVYLAIHFPPQSFAYFIFTTPAYLALAAFLAIAIRIASEQTFKTNPTDYLIILGIVTIGLLGREQLAIQEVSLLVVYSVILLYASELAHRQAAKRPNLLQLGVFLGLSILSIRGEFVGWGVAK